MSDAMILVKMEYLTPSGWVDNGTAGLLHPARYVERLRDKGKFGRATELGDMLRPTGRVWVSDDVPADPSILVKTDEGNVPWALPVQCSLCGEAHGVPFDGSCLL